MKNCPTCQGSFPTNFAVCPQDGTPLLEVGAWGEGSVIRGKYRLLSKVGQGGMGAVYKALHLAFDELRALKVIAPELVSDQLFVRRFKHEAVITRKLQHPNAVRVDDIDEAEDGRPFIVMEYIEGRSLKKLIQDEGPLPAPRVCSIAKQVASALDAAHRLGMVHRDIKPDNIVLVEAPEGEQAKVLDFGIAKVKEARLGEGLGMTLTGTGVVIGTPQYMSPEQAMGKRGDELDGRSDLYSLGVVMYQMLTADLPFKADTTMEMLLAHMQKPPTPIRALHPELQVPESIANLTMRLLEKNRELRPATARALIQEIERTEKEQAPEGTARAVQPTRVISPEEAAATQAGMRPGYPAGKVAAVGGVLGVPEVAGQPAAVAVPAKPVPAVSVKPAAVTSSPKPSRWGLWVAMGVLAVGVGGGGWYFTAHRTSPEPEVPAGSTSTPAQKAPGASAEAPASQPSSSPGSPASENNRSTTTAPPESPAVPIQNASGTSATASQPPSRAPHQAAKRPSSSSTDIAPSGETTTAKPAPSQQAIKAALTQGDFFYGRGEYDEAIKAYQEGLNQDPSNAELRGRLDRVKKARQAEQRVLQ